MNTFFQNSFKTFVLGLSLLGLAQVHTFAFSEVTLDGTFVTNNGFDNLVVNMLLQSDGKIVAGGNLTSYDGISASRIARLNTDGSFDTGYVTGLGFNSVLRGMAIQSDDKVLAGGLFTSYNGTPAMRIVRLNTDGSIDNTFLTGAGANNTVYAISVQPDGKILLGGAFTSYNGTLANKIVRLNTDGSIDTGFSMGTAFGTGAFDSLYRFGIQPDGKILAGGDYSFYDGTPATRIVRLNSDGTIDNSFVSGLGFEDTPFPITFQSDGKILIGGNFLTYDGTPVNSIVRLNTDGSLDNTFVTGSGFNNITRGIALREDGKILVIGSFTAYNGTPANGVTLLNTDGSIDTGFVTGVGVAGGSVESLALQADGKILIGGTFTSYDGILAHRIARLTYTVTLTAPIFTSPVSGSTFMAPVTFLGTGASGNTVDIFDGSGSFVASGLVDTGGNFSIGPVTISGGVYTPVATSIQGSITGTSISLTLDNPPVVSLSGSSSVSLPKGNPYIEYGATWMDDHDGSGSLLLSSSGWIVSGAVDTNVAGIYILQYSYVDTAGNTSNIVTRTVTITPTQTFAGGGGGSSIPTDNCPSGDYSSSYYDNTCEGNTTPPIDEPEEPGEESISYPDSEVYNPSIEDGYCYTRKSHISLTDSNTITTSEEFKKALVFFLSYDMSMFDHIDEFKPNANLTREQAAKLFSQFAMNVLCRQPNTSLRISYSDNKETNSTLSPYLTQAYQLGLMKGSDNGKFRPKDIITKAELNAVIVRMILKSYLPEDTGTRRYDEYNKVSTELGIISQGAGSEPILRKNAALMLFRAYKESVFSLQDIGQESFVLQSRDEFVK